MLHYHSASAVLSALIFFACGYRWYQLVFRFFCGFHSGTNYNFNKYFLIPLLNEAVNTFEGLFATTSDRIRMHSRRLIVLSSFLKSISIQVSIDWNERLKNIQGNAYSANILVKNLNSSASEIKLEGFVNSGIFKQHAPEIQLVNRYSIEKLIDMLKHEIDYLTNRTSIIEKDKALINIFDDN